MRMAIQRAGPQVRQRERKCTCLDKLWRSTGPNGRLATTARHCCTHTMPQHCWHTWSCISPCSFCSILVSPSSRSHCAGGVANASSSDGISESSDTDCQMQRVCQSFAMQPGMPERPYSAHAPPAPQARSRYWDAATGGERTPARA
jgi:hypothetical protein